MKYLIIKKKALATRELLASKRKIAQVLTRVKRCLLFIPPQQAVREHKPQADL